MQQTLRRALTVQNSTSAMCDLRRRRDGGVSALELFTFRT